MTVYLEEIPDDAMDRIYAFNWHQEKAGDGVKILDLQKHDVINVTVSGTVDIDGVTHGFIIDDGDRGGTEVIAFGDPEFVGIAEERERPESPAFVPLRKNLFRYVKFSVYLHMRQYRDFKDKERGLSYDRYFAPGLKTEGHYREWAAQRHLEVGYLSSFPKEVEEIVRASDNGSLTIHAAMEKLRALYPPEETEQQDRLLREFTTMLMEQ